MLRLYGIPQCSTVKKALKWFDDHGVVIDQRIDYRQETPERADLERALQQAGGNPRKIMNTSGQLYREMGLKDQLEGMSTDQILDLLQGEGMLIKRPFVTDGQRVTVGAKESDLSQTWL